MKKSEAVKKMDNLLDSWGGSNLRHEDMFAKELLDFCVDELGMLPPAVKTKDIVYPNGTPEYDVIFEWEPENE